ncbi:MAG TPA: glycoside hydrolase family 15 protein [Nocardioides sp.]|nr:glycoside hydrolase family 15 protein [Nocardioides sp.]
MHVRLLAGTLALGVAVTGALVSLPASEAAPSADPGEKQTWTEGDKTGFGTARERRSNVWFTLQDGRTSEVFYPDLSTPSVSTLELLVTDGATFTDRASEDMTTTVSRPDPRSLRFTQVHEDKDGKYRLTEQHVTDPRRDAYVVKLRLKSLDGGDYKVRVHYDPALDNSGMDDTGRTRGRALVATDGRVSTALIGKPALTELGTDAGPGNVQQTAEIEGDSATLVLGFGRSPAKALRTAQQSKKAPFGKSVRRYDGGWHGYLDDLKNVPASARDIEDEYLASVLVVAAAEDKLNPGAVIASPSAPWVWGNEVPDLSSPSGAYHLVWSRDSYEFATALWAAGDKAAARRIVDWLFEVQQKDDGSFPQNSDVQGTPVWGELQLDEVALPIVLSRLVGRTGAKTWPGVRKAARFLTGFRDEDTGRRAPYSPQERWENQSGYSPNSIAAQISGLVCAADMARKHGRKDLARKWLRIADRWQRKVDDWTVTPNGPLSDAPYYLRLTKNGQPDTASPYPMGDGGPTSVDQREIVDASYLTLVRFGLRPADDPAITNTLGVVDEHLKVETPNGPFWRRFNHDGYGETRTGGEWEITEPGTGTTLGRGWPILTGERGEYAVSAGEDATPYLATMAAAANDSGMISEQVWDGRPPTGEACCPAGEGTRAATPLTWSHGNLVRLAWTIQRGEPVDQQELVAGRYVD